MSAIKLHDSWKAKLAPEFEKPYFKALSEFVKEEYQHETIYPHPTRIFAAFDMCPFDDLKVVILGQDPYHGLGPSKWLVLLC